MAKKKKEGENIRIIKGDIFETSLQTIVNPINLGGTMNKGVGNVLKKRYKKYFSHYAYICKNNLMKYGILWLYDVEDWRILSIPTKINPKNNAVIGDIEKGLDKFVAMYKEKGVESAAFPILDDKIDQEEMIALMVGKLSKCDIPIEIYIPISEEEKKLTHQGEQLQLWN